MSPVIVARPPLARAEHPHATIADDGRPSRHKEVDATARGSARTLDIHHAERTDTRSDRAGLERKHAVAWRLADAGQRQADVVLARKITDEQRRRRDVRRPGDQVHIRQHRQCHLVRADRETPHRHGRVGHRHGERGRERVAHRGLIERGPIEHRRDALRAPVPGDAEDIARPGPRDVHHGALETRVGDVLLADAGAELGVGRLPRDDPHAAPVDRDVRRGIDRRSVRRGVRVHRRRRSPRRSLVVAERVEDIVITARIADAAGRGPHNHPAPEPVGAQSRRSVVRRLRRERGIERSRRGPEFPVLETPGNPDVNIGAEHRGRPREERLPHHDPRPGAVGLDRGHGVIRAGVNRGVVVERLGEGPTDPAARAARDQNIRVVPDVHLVEPREVIERRPHRDHPAVAVGRETDIRVIPVRPEREAGAERERVGPRRAAVLAARDVDVRVRPDRSEGRMARYHRLALPRDDPLAVPQRHDGGLEVGAGGLLRVLEIQRLRSRSRRCRPIARTRCRRRCPPRGSPDYENSIRRPKPPARRSRSRANHERSPSTAQAGPTTTRRCPRCARRRSPRWESR